MERTFHGHPAIKDVAVHSVPSEMGEDEVKVTAVLQSDTQLDELQLCEWSRGGVSRTSPSPRYIEFPRRPARAILSAGC